MSLLEAVLNADKKNNYIALGFSDQKHNERLVAERDNFHYHFLPIPRRLYMGLFRIWQSPIDRFLPHKPDAVWYPDFVAAPLIRTGKKILTIHDLTFIHDSEVVESKNLRYLRRFVPWSINRSDELVTVSETVKHDIIHNLAPTKQITVVYPIAPPEKPGIPNVNSPYILFVGTLEPRKNVETILKAYEALPTPLQKKYKLVLAGRRGWNSDEIFKQMKRVPHTWVDGPTTPELNKLYDGASLFVFPSLREGFGISPIEELARHVPVVTSTDSALIEATGKAALHIAAADHQKLSEAMRDLLTSNQLRDSLGKYRTAQLKKFDGTNAAQRFIELIRAH